MRIAIGIALLAAACSTEVVPGGTYVTSFEHAPLTCTGDGRAIACSFALDDGSSQLYQLDDPDGEPRLLAALPPSSAWGAPSTLALVGGRLYFRRSQDFWGGVWTIDDAGSPAEVVDDATDLAEDGAVLLGGSANFLGIGGVWRVDGGAVPEARVFDPRPGGSPWRGVYPVSISTLAAMGTGGLVLADSTHATRIELGTGLARTYAYDEEHTASTVFALPDGLVLLETASGAGGGGVFRVTGDGTTKLAPPPDNSEQLLVAGSDVWIATNIVDPGSTALPTLTRIRPDGSTSVLEIDATRLAIAPDGPGVLALAGAADGSTGVWRLRP